MPRLPAWFTRRILVRLLMLSAVWGIVFALVYAFSTVQPRMTISLEPTTSPLFDTTIVGITPDGQDLVALTSRLDEATEVFSKATVPIKLQSGPLHIWNLSTGAHRTLCLPFQDCNGPIDPESPRHLMADPEAWAATLVRTAPIRGRWLQLVFEPSTKEEERTPSANLLINLDSGKYHSASDTAEIVSGMELSPTGQWFVELQVPRELSKDRRPAHFRVIATATGQEQLAFDVPGDFSEWAFSPDDRLFAHCTRAELDDTPARLRVWKLDSLELSYEVEHGDSLPAFSIDNKLLAVVLEEHQCEKIVVFDAQTGLRIFEHVLDVQTSPIKYPNALRFSPDRNWLYYSRDGWRPDAKLTFFNHTLDIDVTIDLRTNERVDLPERASDPRIFTMSWPESMPPLMLSSDMELREFPAGRHVARLTEEQQCINVTKDGRLLLVNEQRRQPGALLPAMEFLDSMHVPLPTTWWNWVSFPEPEWLIKDVQMHNTVTRMPAQNLDHWLISDESRLVTTSNDDLPVIHVWDFPPRKPFWTPAMWALIAPGLLILFSRFRQWRHSRHNPVVVAGGGT